MKLIIKQEVNLGGNKHLPGDVIEVSDELGSNLMSHRPESFASRLKAVVPKVEVKVKPEELDLDLNNDGKVDKEDISLAAKVLNKAKSILKKPAKKKSGKKK